MISMNKFLADFERWFENLAQARVNTCPMTLDRDPWSLHTIPTRRHAALEQPNPGIKRTKTVRVDCTIAGQTGFTNDASKLSPAQTDAIETPRSAA